MRHSLGAHATANDPREVDMREREEPQAEQDTVAAIVDAAESLISVHGVGGTSAAMIAERAGVAKSLVFYHFGNKAGVCNAIEARHADTYARNLTRWLDQADDDFEALKMAFLSYYEFLMSDPRVARTMVGFYLDEHETTEKLARLRMRLVGIAKRAQTEGLIRTDCDPLVMIIVGFSTIEHWFLIKFLFQDASKGTVVSDDDFIEEVLKLLLDGLLPEHLRNDASTAGVEELRRKVRLVEEDSATDD